MNLQVIKSVNGDDEYVLLPMPVYKALQVEIDARLDKYSENDDYTLFKLSDYVENPIAYARIKADLTQEQLAQRMGVSQAYISKLEKLDNVSAKVLQKVKRAISARKKRA